MVEEEKKLGWRFMIDGIDGIPYFQCPNCGRKISGKTAIFMPYSLDYCPECAKKLHFDNIKEEDWLYIDAFFGDTK